MGRPCRCCSQEPGCPICGTPRKTTLSITIPSLPMFCPVVPCAAGSTSPPFSLSLTFTQPFGEGGICYYYGQSLGGWSHGSYVTPLYNIAGVYIGWFLEYTVWCGPDPAFPGCSRNSPTYFNEDCTGSYVLMGNGDNQGPHPDTMEVSG